MQKSSRKYPWLGLIGFILLCFALSGLGGLITASNLDNWYASLLKPSWTPPAWVFGPAWTFLYLCMSVAAWLAWRQGNTTLPMILFALQLALNAAWPWLFFGLHSPLAGLIDIVLLWIAIVATTAIFWRRSRVAGLLFMPYVAWVGFAACLNFAIWRLNW